MAMLEVPTEDEELEDSYHINKFQNNNAPSGIYIAATFNKWGQVIGSTKFFKN